MTVHTDHSVDSTLEQALRFLARESYCLWVGAGVSTQLGLAAQKIVPGWTTLLEKLELLAKIQLPAFQVGFPERADLCLRRLQREQFQATLRQELLVPLASAIVESHKAHRIRVPDQARQLAHLGTLANPIVNFNLETLTSRAIAAPGGPWHALVFRPPVPDAVTSPRSDLSDRHTSRFQRHVYHPHGALDVSGICVFGAREYSSMQGTLGLQLAAHASFQLNLAIVGMSLDDKYLRDQLTSFRDQVRRIYWFVSDRIEGDAAEWVYKNDVHAVTVRWPDFWIAVQSCLPAPNECALRWAWEGLVMNAAAALGSPMTDAVNRFISAFNVPVEELAAWIRSAQMEGEKVTLSASGVEGASDGLALTSEFLTETVRMLRAGECKGNAQ